MIVAILDYTLKYKNVVIQAVLAERVKVIAIITMNAWEASYAGRIIVTIQSFHPEEPIAANMVTLLTIKIIRFISCV